MQGEDFGGESVQVGGEGGEGDVFGGFLVVVAELLFCERGFVSFAAFWGGTDWRDGQRWEMDSVPGSSQTRCASRCGS